MDQKKTEGKDIKVSLHSYLDKQRDEFRKEQRRSLAVFLLCIVIIVGGALVVVLYQHDTTVKLREEVLKIEQEADAERLAFIEMAFDIKDFLREKQYVTDVQAFESFVLTGTSTVLMLYERDKVEKDRRMSTAVLKQYLTLMYTGGNLIGMDPYLSLAIDYVESGFIPGAVSPVGARGISQMMPYTAKMVARSTTPYDLLQVSGYNPDSLFDPLYNKKLHLRFIKALLEEFGGRVEWALFAYNWGPDYVQRKWWNMGESVFHELPIEQREFANNVLAIYNKIKAGVD